MTIKITEYRTLTDGTRDVVATRTFSSRHRRKAANALVALRKSVRESGLRGGVIVEENGEAIPYPVIDEKGRLMMEPTTHCARFGGLEKAMNAKLISRNPHD